MSYDLDLDLAAPQPKTVRLNGQVVEVFPPKLKVMMLINSAAKKLESGDTENGMPELIEAISAVVPILKDPNVDISISQLLALTTFIGKISVPETEPASDDGEVKKN